LPRLAGVTSPRHRWSDGANHEALAPLLRADGDPVRHGTTQNQWHGVGVFRRVEIQPGAPDSDRHAD